MGSIQECGFLDILSRYFYLFSYIVQNDYQDERNLTSFSRNIHCGAKIHNLS